MSILECYGQDRAVYRLQRARRGRRIPHSYIFHGPEGVGKGLLARQWVKLLLCSQPVRRPYQASRGKIGSHLALEEIDDSCDQCPDCHLVEAGTHPDLHIVTRDLARFLKENRAKDTPVNFRIGVIREFVIKPAGQVPNRGRARVFIIEEAETMTTAAQNALLKTLEEPPSDTFLVLVSSHPERFLPTVRSRCQSVRFQPLPVEFIEEKLISAGIAEVEARYWARFSHGRLGPALELAGMDLYKIKRELDERMAGLDYSTVLDLAGWLVEQAKAFGKMYQKKQVEEEEASQEEPDGEANDKGNNKANDKENDKEKEKEASSSATRLGQRYFLQMLSDIFSKSLRYKILGEKVGARADISEKKTGIGHEPVESQIARLYSPWSCAEAIRATSRAGRLLEANVNHTLLFESLLIKYMEYASS